MCIFEICWLQILNSFNLKHNLYIYLFKAAKRVVHDPNPTEKSY